jgi:hypothetical protein
MATTTENLTVHLPTAQAEAVRAHAARLGIPVSTVIRLAIVDAIVSRPLVVHDDDR